MDKYIYRFIEEDMQKWKHDLNEKILFISGSHVGKTTTILHFAHENYEHVLYINAAADPSAADLAYISEYSAQKVIRALCRKAGIEYTDDHNTVLILDDIQEHTAIFERVRVFRKSLGCDVIAAGSYSGSFKKHLCSLGGMYIVQMHPISYQELLNYYDAYDYYIQHSIEEICSNPPVFRRLKAIYEAYLLSGGYPDIFSIYIKGRSVETAFRNLIDNISREYAAVSDNPSDLKAIYRTFHAICSDKRECSDSNAWLHKSHIVNYVEWMDLKLSAKFPGEKTFFEDIGLANYLYSKYDVASSCRNVLLAETFIYKQLIENHFCDRFCYDRPCFDIKDNGKLMFYVQSRYDNLGYCIEANAKKQNNSPASNLPGSLNVNIAVYESIDKCPEAALRKYTIPIFLFGKFDFTTGEKVVRESPGMITNFTDLSISEDQM